MQAFIICGYGIPKNIAQDENYSSYLHVVFNTVYEHAAHEEAMIVPCGGPTECDPLYQKTEAGMIAEYFTDLMSRKETVDQTKGWNIFQERDSLSTLENLLFAKKILGDVNSLDELIIFCEKTREKRVQAFADKIFNQKCTVCAIDFDISKNRYLDPDVLHKKEALALKEGLWTLEEPERIKRHHEFFQQKFEFLRRRQSEGLSHVDAVKEWFENQEHILRQLMPDHPLLK